MKIPFKLICFILFTVICGTSYAYDFEANGFYFNIIDATNHEVEVTYKDTNYKSYSGVIDIPSSVTNDGTTYTITSIGQRAFQDCGTLLSVNIPNSVKAIKDYAFYGTYGIYSLTIGTNVQTIGKHAFDYKTYNCINIKKTIWLCNTLPSGTTNFSSEVNYVSSDALNLSNQVVYPFLSSRFEVDNVVYVPVSPSDRTCDVIDCNYNPTNGDIVIDSIVSNRGVQLKVLDVKDYSFYDNNSITSLVISNAGNIKDYAFCGCSGLATVTASNNGNIGDSSFNSCIALTSVTSFNNGSIGSYAFADCRALTELKLGDKVTQLGGYAFYRCIKLSEVIIPDNVTSLDSSVFSDCSSLQSVEIGYGITKIPYYAFSNCISLPEITIPSNITVINNYSFRGCSSLADVKIESYPHEAEYFDDWTSTNHDHNSTSSHEYNIHVKAGGILSFTLWADSESFDKVTAEINGNVVTSTSGNNKSESYTQAFSADTDIILTIYYTKNGTISYYSDCGGIKNLALNDLPITLGSNYSSPLFADCPLDEVYIGKKLTYATRSDYGYSPFYRNTSLRSVKITDAETEIYDNEFYGCSNLQEFECGDGVEKIGNRAFSGCSKLASYSSGTNVKEIGEEAFSDCIAMTSFTSHAAEPPVCGNQALDDINKWECTLHVPAESIDDYKAAPQWKEFFFIEEAGVDDITTDGNDLSIKVIGTEMTIEGAEALPVAVYTIDGRLCAIYNAYNGESISLGKGCYIVRAGNMTAKVMI